MYTAQITKERIKFMCKSKKINMEQVLTECSLGVNAIRQINDAKGMASFSLAKIADYLDCSVDYLLGRTDTPDICASQHYNNENGVQVVGSSDTNVSYHNGAECSMQDKELLELIRGLSLKQKAKVITYIYEVIESE